MATDAAKMYQVQIRTFRLCYTQALLHNMQCQTFIITLYLFNKVNIISIQTFFCSFQLEVKTREIWSHKWKFQNLLFSTPTRKFISEVNFKAM